MLKIFAQKHLIIQNQLLLLSKRSWSSIISEHVRCFDDSAATWWDPNGPMKPLHMANPHQITFIRNQLSLKDGTKPGVALQQPLTGYKIADIGCGVGMISERLALWGAEVLGLDPAERSINVAKAHSASNPKLKEKLKYIASTVEEHRVSHSGQYDVVIAIFVIEHIQNKQEFVDNCLALLKPNGSLFIGHGHRSFVHIFYILWHKYVTGLFLKSLALSNQNFLKNDELVKMVNQGHPCELKGEQSFFWTLDGQSFRVTQSKLIANIFHFVKNM